MNGNPNVRRTDPDTSHAAAGRLSSKAQAFALLRTFKWIDRTAEEAAVAAGLLNGNHYTKRISDLIRDGLLEDTGARRAGSSGRAQRVLRPTKAGLRALEAAA